jgi:hypothetical protein
MNVPSEHAEQAAVCDWLDLHPSVIWFAVPNGAKLGGTKAQRFGMVNKLKREGMTPGAPDIIILAPRGQYHGCLLEMKRVKGGKLSDNQREFLARAEQAGYYTIVGYGAESAIQLLEEYLSWQK